MTLQQMLNDLYTRLDIDPAAPSALNTQRLTSFINQTQENIFSRPGFSQLLHATAGFTSVADQAEYGFLSSVARVLAIQDTANQRRLSQVTESWYRTVLPNQTMQTGTPWAYAQLGLKSIALLPSSFDGTPRILMAGSDSAADTQDLTISMVSAVGAIKTVTVALTGTTILTLSLVVDAWDVADWHLSSNAVGTVTLYVQPIVPPPGPSEAIASIYPGTSRTSYLRYALVPTPSAAIDYVIEYEFDPQPLTLMTDEPSLPKRFHDLLPTGARMMEYERRGDSERLDIATRAFEQGIGLLNDYLVNPPDLQYIPGRRVASQTVLPGAYPGSPYGAGSW